MKTIISFLIFAFVTLSVSAQSILKPVGVTPDSKASYVTTDPNRFVIKGGSGTTFTYDTLATVNMSGLDSLHLYVSFEDSANCFLLAQGLGESGGTKCPTDTVGVANAAPTPLLYFATLTAKSVGFEWWNIKKALGGHDGSVRFILKFDPDVTAVQARGSKGTAWIKTFPRAK